MEIFALVLILLSLHNTIQGIDNKIVITGSGPVRGQLLKTLFGEKEYYSFKGIPYAEPPVNNLRYKAPVPVQPWNTTIEAFEFSNYCLQPGTNGTINGDEDCLYLNIYIPIETANELLPVMFYIHGGGYVYGSGNDFFTGPDFLIEQDVVVVTINYRLGIAGFVSFGTPEISGNAGLKDQVLALRWINENINHFGGDPKKITIFGHSAGGSSVNLLIISPIAQGLYHRAIVMSGSAYNTWATINYNEQLEHAKYVARQLQPPVEEIDDIIKAFQSYDARTLLNLSLIPYYVPGQDQKVLEFWWRPVIENENHTGTFITREPETIYEDQSTDIKTDVMFGITSEESLLFLGPESTNPELLKPFDEHFKLPLPYKDSKLSIQSEDYKPLGEEIRQHYFGDKRVDGNSIQEYSELLSDVWFTYGVLKTAKYHAQKSKGKTYFYRVSIDARLNAYKYSLNASQIIGTGHGDDICYLFRCHAFSSLYTKLEPDAIERELIQRLTTQFTNFAKYGNPTSGLTNINLKPVTNETINYIDIRNDGLYKGTNPNERGYQFWEKLYKKYRNIIRSG